MCLFLYVPCKHCTVNTYQIPISPLLYYKSLNQSLETLSSNTFSFFLSLLLSLHYDGSMEYTNIPMSYCTYKSILK